MQEQPPGPGSAALQGLEQPLEPGDTVLWIYILNTHTDPPRQGGAGAFPSEDAETLLLPTNTRPHPTQGSLLPLKFKLLQRGTDRQDVHRQAHQGQGREIECPKALGAVKGRTGPFL